MNELAKLPSSQLTDYKTPTKERIWELSYGREEKFYLTEVEKNEFMKQIVSGKDVVCLNDMVLTRFFKYLIPVKNAPKDFNSLMQM